MQSSGMEWQSVSKRMLRKSGHVPLCRVLLFLIVMQVQSRWTTVTSETVYVLTA